jgi:hypothetical protein
MDNVQKHNIFNKNIYYFEQFPLPWAFFGHKPFGNWSASVIKCRRGKAPTYLESLERLSVVHCRRLNDQLRRFPHLHLMTEVFSVSEMLRFKTKKQW